MTIQKALAAAGLCLAFAAGFAVRGVVSEVTPAVQAQGNHVWELRTYTAAPGKWENINARFRDHTLKLFEKHGMKNVVYLTPVEEDNKLVYLLAHKSREAAKKSFADFVA